MLRASVPRRKSAHDVHGVFSMVLSMLMRMTGRASFVAFNTIYIVTEVAAVSHHPGLCECRGGACNYFASAERRTSAIGLAMSETLLGCEGKKRSF